MIIRTTSHRSRQKVDRALGRHPSYYFTFEDGGRFLNLTNLFEIESVLKIKGVTKCRNQNEDSYHKCWESGVVLAPETTGANHRSPFGPGA
jgi:hypothetical protein